MLKVNNKNIRTRSKLCSTLIIKTSERRHWRHSDVFIVNFEHISHRALVNVLVSLMFFFGEKFLDLSYGFSGLIYMRCCYCDRIFGFDLYAMLLLWSNFRVWFICDVVIVIDFSGLIYMRCCYCDRIFGFDLYAMVLLWSNFRIIK